MKPPPPGPRLIAGVVVATPAAYIRIAVTVPARFVAIDTTSMAAPHVVRPVTMTHRRPARSDTKPMTGRTASVVTVWRPNSQPNYGVVSPSTSRP